MESKYILIQPFAKQMRNGEPHPKNYPYWEILITMIKQWFPDYKIIQIGIEGEKQLVPNFKKNMLFKDIEFLVDNCTTWIGIDSFLQHLGWARKKKGIAIFAKQDPLIFGHSENINLLKDRKYLRDTQFWMHEQTEFNKEDFVSPDVVMTSLTFLLKEINTATELEQNINSIT